MQERLCNLVLPESWDDLVEDSSSEVMEARKKLDVILEETESEESANKKDVLKVNEHLKAIRKETNCCCLS